MARKNSGEVRIKGMSQQRQRSYKKKISPNSRKDGFNWTDKIIRKLSEGENE